MDGELGKKEKKGTFVFPGARAVYVMDHSATVTCCQFLPGLWQLRIIRCSQILTSLPFPQPQGEAVAWELLGQLYTTVAI